MKNAGVHGARRRSLVFKIGLWLIIAISIIIIFLVVDKMTVNQRFTKAVKDYLAETYPDETFQVEEQWHDMRETGPIPHFDFPRQCYYRVHPDSEPDYGFVVYITKSKYSYKIENIRDSYYWRILRRQIQNYAIEHLYDKLGEMKVDFRENGSLFGFEGFNSESTLEDYFERGNRFTSVMNIYIPKRIDEVSEENLTSILKEFIKGIKSKTDIFGEVSAICIFCLDDLSNYDLLVTDEDENPLYDNKRIIESREGRFYWQDKFSFQVATAIGFEDVE